MRNVDIGSQNSGTFTHLDGDEMNPRSAPWLTAALDQMEKQASVLLNLLVPTCERLYGPRSAEESKDANENANSVQGHLSKIDRCLAEAINHAREVHDAVC